MPRTKRAEVYALLRKARQQLEHAEELRGQLEDVMVQVRLNKGRERRRAPRRRATS